MKIELVWGSGEGKTELSAFDAALADAGIHNYNLVTLSSVIPKGGEVVEVGSHEPEWGVGETVSVILSEMRSSVAGERIAAGLGWATAEEGGIFYEANSHNTENVEELIHRGIESAKQKRGGWNWDSGIDMKVIQHSVEKNGAVVVSAVYSQLETRYMCE